MPRKKPAAAAVNPVHEAIRRDVESAFPNPVLTVEQTQRALGSGETFVRELINSGALLATQHAPGRRGSPVRVLRSSIVDYLFRSLR